MNCPHKYRLGAARCCRNPLRLVLSCVLLAAASGAAQAQEPSERGPASSLTVEPFEFHSNFWINLHHFLYMQAMPLVSCSFRANRKACEGSVRPESLRPELDSVSVQTLRRRSASCAFMI
jgi:hypothetical protein